MNKIKQFWALFKFQRSINPFIVFMPLILAMPFYLTHLTGSIGRNYHPDLDLLLSNQNLFFVGFIGVMCLAPDMFQFAASQAMWSSGTEFLLTRAVDRPLLLRARVAFFYLLVLVIPVAALLVSLRQPTLQLSEYHKISHRQILEKIPESIAAPPDKSGRSDEITIPHGNALVESWRLWIFLTTAIGTQVLIFSIYSLKHRRYIFWAIYMGVILLPIIPLFHPRNGALTEKLSFNETLFLAFVGHQPAFWLLMAVALLSGQLWCERRFARLEP